MCRSMKNLSDLTMSFCGARHMDRVIQITRFGDGWAKQGARDQQGQQIVGWIPLWQSRKPCLRLYGGGMSRPPDPVEAAHGALEEG